MIAMVVPCFNEEKRINIPKWQLIVNNFPDCYWIFVNDGSSDGTSLLLNKLSGKNMYQLDLPTNLGKGNAIRAGFNYFINFPLQDSVNYMNFANVGYIDSDGAFDLNDIKLLFSTALEKRESVPPYKVFVGARVKLAGRQIERSKRRHYVGRLIATFVCLGWDKAPYDTQSGFKIFSLDSMFREALKMPFRTSWFFDIELILRLDNFDSLLIWETPVMKWKDIGESSIKSSGYLNIFRQIIIIRSLVKLHTKNAKRCIDLIEGNN
jgi:glycosyltransferase involved in cell wall biosynthesis